MQVVWSKIAAYAPAPPTKGMAAKRHGIKAAEMVAQFRRVSSNAGRPLSPTPS